jgi:hypothetical protein
MALIHWLGSLIEPSVAAWIILMGVIFLALFCMAKLEWEVMHHRDPSTTLRTGSESTEKSTLTEYKRSNGHAKKAGS